MISKFNIILLFIAITIICTNVVSSQDIQNIEEIEAPLQIDEEGQEYLQRKFRFYNYRGTNAFEASAGSAIANGDYQDSEFEVYFRVGYKYHLTSHLNVNLTYNKYNIAFKDISNQGFMSFDLNFEILMCPYSTFTPFIYAGGGYNAANYFATTSTKLQGGLGFEVIVTKHLGLKLFGEYNYLFTDDIDGLVEGAGDDSLIRMGLGVNIYFGGKKKREEIRKKLPTVFNSNPIIPNNKKQSLLLQDQQ